MFGGCSDEDADDEFFISSGAVYQSWPYVHEPGFNMKPLPQLPLAKLSISDETINYSAFDTAFADTTNNNGNNQDMEQLVELTTYSLHNYGINLLQR